MQEPNLPNLKFEFALKPLDAAEKTLDQISAAYAREIQEQTLQIARLRRKAANTTSNVPSSTDFTLRPRKAA